MKEHRTVTQKQGIFLFYYAVFVAFPAALAAKYFYVFSGLFFHAVFVYLALFFVLVSLGYAKRYFPKSSKGVAFLFAMSTFHAALTYVLYGRGATHMSLTLYGLSQVGVTLFFVAVVFIRESFLLRFTDRRKKIPRKARYGWIGMCAMHVLLLVYVGYHVIYGLLVLQAESGYTTIVAFGLASSVAMAIEQFPFYRKTFMDSITHHSI